MEVETIIHELAVGLYIGNVKRKPHPGNSFMENLRDEIDPVALPLLDSRPISALFCAGGRQIVTDHFETAEVPLPSTELMDSEMKRTIDKLEKAAVILKNLIDAGHNVLIYADDFRQQSALFAAFYLIRVGKRPYDGVIRELETCLFSPQERSEDANYPSARASLQERYRKLPDKSAAISAELIDEQRKALDAESITLESMRERRDKKRCLCRTSFKKLLRGVK